MSNKTDSKLGKIVNSHLLKLGIESPVYSNTDYKNIGIDELEYHYKSIHTIMGLDLSNDSITETPKRLAKTLLHETASGLNYDNFPKITIVKNDGMYDDSVTVNDILVMSMCEHHWERIIMRVSISYIPDDKVIGLSKLARIAEFFAARPIIQERYTKQVAESLICILGDNANVAVHVRGIHLCMLSRGVKSPCGTTTTKSLNGYFRNCVDVRNNFINSIDITKPILPL